MTLVWVIHFIVLDKLLVLNWFIHFIYFANSLKMFWEFAISLITQIHCNTLKYLSQVIFQKAMTKTRVAELTKEGTRDQEQNDIFTDCYEELIQITKTIG